jgi:transposase-like protein
MKDSNVVELCKSRNEFQDHLTKLLQEGAQRMLAQAKAAGCLEKDREELLAFYDFPAEHWKHIRTTNPIESTFATVRLRTNKTRNCLSRESVLTMVFRLCQCAEKNGGNWTDQNTWLRSSGTSNL